MHIRRLLLPLGFLLPALSLLAAKGELYPGLGRKWQYYQSPNFELYSANNDRESREVLERMELLRALFLDTFHLQPRLPQPVTLYFFARQEEFDAYLPGIRRGRDSHYVGYCLNHPDRTVITLAPTRDSDQTREVVYHEYIHHLFKITEQNPVPWFNEGMAELFSTMDEDKDWLVLGKPVEGRVRELHAGRMMSFEELFNVSHDSPVFRDSSHTGIFYAQSWAFLHYCRFGLHKIPPDKLDLFLRIAGSPKIQERPAEFRTACRELLGMDYPELLRELERYVTSGRFQGRRAKRPAIADRQTYQVRPVTADEMALRLAEVLVRAMDSAAANLFVLGRLEQGPDARLHELLGSIALRNDDPDLARDHWRKAVELGTANAAIFRELGRLESNAIFGQFNLDYRMPEEKAARLRTLLLKSIECAPTQSMGYEMLAWVEGSVAKPVIANVNLIQKNFETLNDKPRTLLALVLVRYHLGDIGAGLKLLDQLDKFDLNPWSAFCAEVTRARLEDRPIDRSKLPAGGPDRPGSPIRLPKIELPH